MTLNEARRLSVGDAVLWVGENPAEGRVTDKGYTGITVKWDDGEHTTVGFHWSDVDDVLKNLERKIDKPVNT